MFELVGDAIKRSDEGSIDWRQSRQDVVEGVEAVFSAIKDREDAEMELLESLWDVVEEASELAGPAKWIFQGAALAAFAPFAGIGAGYMQAAAEIKRREAAIAFCEGLIMGVMLELPDNVRSYFWRENPIPNPVFPEAAKMAQYYSNGGLALGYAHGRDIQKRGMTDAFWADIRPELDGPLGNPDEGWGRRDWIDFYITVATAFYRRHIDE